MRVSIQGGEYRVVLGRLCGDPSVTQEHDTCSSLLLDLLHRLTEQVTSRHLLYPLSGLIIILLQIAIEPLISLLVVIVFLITKQARLLTITSQRDGERSMYDMARSLLGEDGIDMLKQLSLILGPGSDLSVDIVELLSKLNDPPSDRHVQRGT